MMIETFEARQLFSATMTETVTPTVDASVQPPPVVVDADAAAKKGTGKPSIGTISFSHYYDIASPTVMQ
jgi:hypothetical protein